MSLPSQESDRSSMCI